MQIFRDKFPGKVHVLDSLPRLGLLFLKFFSLYNRVELKPYLPFKGLPMKVRFSIERFGDSTMIIPASEKSPQFNLAGLDPFWREFKIEPKHVGKDFPTIAGKFTNWLNARILDLLKPGAFYLILSDELADILRYHRNAALEYFLFKGRIFDLQKIESMKLHFVIKSAPVRGLVMPQKDDYLFARWNDILPSNSEHYKLVELVSKWHQKWCNVISLMSADDVCIDVDRLWEGYQGELSQYKHLLEDEE